MSIEGRLESLSKQHSDLKARIKALQGEKAPDKYIDPLKKQKLELKDEINRLKNA